LLLVLLGQHKAAFGELTSPLIEFFQADDPRLVRIEQPLCLPVQSPELGLQLVDPGLLACVFSVGALGYVTELGEQHLWLAEKSLYMVPDRCLQTLCWRHPLRTALLPRAAHAIFTAAAIIARS
jgi:hypothetical protein